MRFVLVVLLVCLSSDLVLGFAFHADRKVVLNNETRFAEEDASYIYEDSTNALSITDMVKPFWNRKVEVEDQGLKFNRNKGFTYWKKIYVINKSFSPTWLLEFPDPHIGHLKLYATQKGEIKEYETVGFDEPFPKRSLAHKNFVFPVQIQPNDTVVFYVKIKSERKCGFSAQFRSVPNFVEYFLAEYHILGLYYGIILILVVYNLFLSLYTREKLYLYYCLYTISCALFTYAEDGMAFQWLWPNSPYLNILLDEWAPVLLLGTFLLYSSVFVDLGKRHPKLQRSILFCSLLYLISHFVLIEYPKVSHILYIIPFALTFYTAIVIYKQGLRFARFFLAGNSIVLISFVVFYCRISGWIDSNVFTVYLFNYGFVFEAVIFSIALADRVRIAKDQREQAQKEIIYQLEINESLQQKVNRELEEKVQERTKELVEANSKLEGLKKELYEMNSKMDVNIWELKKEVKKEMEARILNDTVPYEEFMSVYTDTKCYQYLKALKWKDGFVCPKCGNKKFGRGNNNYTLKCTQCQHQESVTSHTLFHGVKFPISKAFYLAYYLLKNGNDKTYEELAQQVGLTKNTVWKFGKKVTEAIQLLGKKKNTSGMWETLVLTIAGK